MVNTDLVEVRSFESIAPARTSTFKVVASAPMRLDLTTINHADQKVLVTKAIYQLKGNVLIYCVGAPGQRRPTSFTTVAGDGNTLVVLKRRLPLAA